MFYKNRLTKIEVDVESLKRSIDHEDYFNPRSMQFYPKGLLQRVTSLENKLDMLVDYLKINEKRVSESVCYTKRTKTK